MIVVPFRRNPVTNSNRVDLLVDVGNILSLTVERWEFPKKREGEEKARDPYKYAGHRLVRIATKLTDGHYRQVEGWVHLKDVRALYRELLTSASRRRITGTMEE